MNHKDAIAYLELDFECNGYEWGTEEHEFLMELYGEIEDVLRGGRR